MYAFNPGLVVTKLLTDVDVVPGYKAWVKRLVTVVRLGRILMRSRPPKRRGSPRQQRSIIIS